MAGEERAQRQREEVASCRAAAPAALANLWETIAHAPDRVLPDARDELAAAYPEPSARLRRYLEWLGHGAGECPLCWMFVGRLPFELPELGALLPSALAEAPPVAWLGAGRFLATRLEPRHAVAGGLSRAGLSALRAELEASAGAWKLELRARWVEAGQDPGALAHLG